MTTTLGLTVLATCAVFMPLETVVPSAALSESAEELSDRSTCWMMTLLLPPKRAPTKPPIKPMAAASTRATMLFTALSAFFLGFFGAAGAVFCGPAGGGVAPPEGWVLSLKAEAVFAVFMPLEPTLG
jgi:hypothetical protein